MRKFCNEEEEEEQDQEEEEEEVESEDNAALFLCEGSAASRICYGTRESISNIVTEVLFGIRCTGDFELDICCTLARRSDPYRSPTMACRGQEHMRRSIAKKMAKALPKRPEE